MSILRFSGPCAVFFFFFFNDTATTEIYTLSLHDALPISVRRRARSNFSWAGSGGATTDGAAAGGTAASAVPTRRKRSEEHTSELQSLAYLVCRLLLEKKKTQTVKPELAVTASNRDRARKH